MRRIRSERLRLLWVAGVLAPAAMVIIGFLLSWVATRGLPNLRLPAWTDLLLGLATAALSMGLVTLLYRTSKTFERALRETGTRVGEEALQMAGYPVMLVVVVAAALGEEVLFRGGLQPLIGLVPAALLFGFSHGGWRREMWAYAVAASISGGLFGLAYRLTGDLWVPMMAHALHNIASTFLLGKKVDVTREGFWPVVRLVSEADEEDEETEWDEESDDWALTPDVSEEADSVADQEEASEVANDEPVADPVPGEGDSPEDGAEEWPPADRPPE